jgi:hypothetical protein
MTAIDDLRKLYEQCRMNGTSVDPRVAAVAIRAVGDYTGIRSQYVNDIQAAMIYYMLGEIGMAAAKGQFKRAMATAFVNGFETGYIDGAGGNVYEPEPEDTQWLASRTDQELGYIDTLFLSLKDIIKGATEEEPVTQVDVLDIAEARATGFGLTLDGVYAQGKLRGKKNIMLTFDGPNGSSDNICQKNNGTCVRLMRKRHSAKYWISRDLVPYRGNVNYDCGCYECRHFLRSDAGERYAGPQE